MGRRAFAVAVAVSGRARAQPAPSQAAVTVGVADLSTPSSGIAGSGGSATFINTALPAGNQLTAPINGVVVRYRVQSTTWGNIALRILRPAGGGTFDAVGTSEPGFAGGAFDDLAHVFPARLPISIGDSIGMDADNNARLRNSVTGAQWG